MTDEEQKERSQNLSNMLSSAGGIILFKHIDDEIRDGWKEFINLPVAQKTSKAAFNYQARYDVLKNLKEWLMSEIRLGQ